MTHQPCSDAGMCGACETRTCRWRVTVCPLSGPPPRSVAPPPSAYCFAVVPETTPTSGVQASPSPGLTALSEPNAAPTKLKWQRAGLQAPLRFPESPSDSSSPSSSPQTSYPNLDPLASRLPGPPAAEGAAAAAAPDSGSAAQGVPPRAHDEDGAATQHTTDRGASSGEDAWAVGGSNEQRHAAAAVQPTSAAARTTSDGAAANDAGSFRGWKFPWAPLLWLGGAFGQGTPPLAQNGGTPGASTSAPRHKPAVATGALDAPEAGRSSLAADAGAEEAAGGTPAVEDSRPALEPDDDPHAYLKNIGLVVSVDVEHAAPQSAARSRADDDRALRAFGSGSGRNGDGGLPDSPVKRLSAQDAQLLSELDKAHLERELSRESPPPLFPAGE